MANDLAGARVVARSGGRLARHAAVAMMHAYRRGHASSFSAWPASHGRCSAAGS
jgi:hypothetical protein